ncbi:MAG: hypothetical protein IJZ71_02655 [Treponema sp.]|nr:hypothetical protein [Treponema sp.]
MKNKKLFIFVPLILMILLGVGCDGLFQPEESQIASKRNPINLTINEWTNGEITQEDKNGSGEQWFSFTTTDSLQYIYIKFGSLKSLYVSLYDSEYNQIGDKVFFEGSGGQVKKIDRSFDNNTIYYIRISETDSWRTSERSGTYKIGFTEFPAQPGTVITELNLDTWMNGEIIQENKNGSGEQWFSFTATDSMQHIYIKFGSLESLYVSIYDSEYNQIGDKVIFEGSGAQVKKIDRSFDNNTIYYIRVSETDSWRTSERSGTYKIGFTEFPAQPGTVITELNLDTWMNGEIIQENKNGSGEQWFSFTATDSLQYIYIKFGSLKSLYVSLYDSEYNQISDRVIFEGNGGQVKKIDRVVDDNTIYYIRVSETDSWRTSERSGTFHISINTRDEEPL